uniref:DH domain-containing protein n=1 Tax=Meloidogyne hapla TaxID=6305 RepID=A0A1I8BMN3_MELHA
MLLHKSRKDCEKYSHNGFCYVKDRESSDGEIIFWRCDEKGRGCKGRTTVSLQNIAVQQQAVNENGTPKKNERRFMVCHEILDTEENYLRILKVLIEVYFELFNE